MQQIAPHLHDIYSSTNQYMVSGETVYAFPITDPEPAGQEAGNGELGNSVGSRYGTPPPGFSLRFTILLRDNLDDLPGLIDPPPTIWRTPSQEPPFFQRTLASANRFLSTYLCGTSLFGRTTPVEELELAPPRPTLTISPARTEGRRSVK